MSRRPLILLLLLTALVYSQHVWTAQYVYEDSQTMQFEPIYVQVTTTGDINPAHVQRMHWGDVPPFATLAWSNLLPSRWASRVTWELAADNNPRAQHVVNLIVHLVNGSLVWLLAEAVFGDWFVTALVTALFLLHPIQIETVAYVTERTELLALTGILSACLAAARGSLLGVVAASLLAMTSKETGVIVVGLVPAWLLMTRRISPTGVLLSLAMALAGTLAAPRAWTVIHDPYLWTGSWSTAGWNAVALNQYFLMVFVPTGLSIEHDWGQGGPWTVALSAAVLTLVAVLPVLLWRINRVLACAMLWIVVAVLPRFVVRSPEILSEHQVYTALVGVWVGMGEIVAQWTGTEDRHAAV